MKGTKEDANKLKDLTQIKMSTEGLKLEKIFQNIKHKAKEEKIEDKINT